MLYLSDLIANCVEGQLLLLNKFLILTSSVAEVENNEKKFSFSALRNQEFYISYHNKGFEPC